MPQFFVCYICKQQFHQTNSDEQVQDQLEQMYPDRTKDGEIIDVCDDCFGPFMDELEPGQYRYKKFFN